MPVTFRKVVEPVCRSSARRPLLWFLVTLLLTLPSIFELGRLGLNTDLVRLLPTASPAARWTRALEQAVGDEGYFTILFESDDPARTLAAVRDTAERARGLAGVHSAEYEYPLDFISRYRYLLVPEYYLEKILDYLIGLEAEVSPLGEDILSDDRPASSKEKREDGEMKALLGRYSHLTAYHQSPDGRIMGLFIRPQTGLTSLGELRRLWLEIEALARGQAERYSLWTGVGGSQIENLKEYDIIGSDLRLSGTIATVLILLVLVLSFRSAAVLPVLLYPLAAGLAWSFSLVPPVLGNLNIITSFLILVLFGMGIDFSIHLVRRFQLELGLRPPGEALLETYLSTGSSVAISGGTTALALLVLALSKFRGFSEYGLICGGSLVLTLLAMLLVMPSALILGHRLGLVKPLTPGARRGGLPPRRLSWLVGAAVAVSLAAAAVGLRFDYDFNSLKPDAAESARLREKSGEVYARYMSPGAVYLAPDLESLDKFLEVLDARRREPASLIQRVASVRDFAPSPAQAERRWALFSEIREEVEGAWTDRVEDPDVRRWIDDLRGWSPPPAAPRYDELPAALRSGLEARDGSGGLVVGIYPSVPRGNGRNAMRFTRELYSLALPQGIKGPVGEMPVFAEILWVVASEGPWVVAATFLSVILLVFIGNRSIGETIRTILPLLGGLVLTFGVMAAAGIKLNFFSVVVIPTLIGLGEDHGVHYYRRWKELGEATAEVHGELMNPLTVATLTTMLGYSGMLFASHPGLRSIGLFACLGMSCLWLTSLVLFPGLLELWRKRREPDRGTA